MTVPSVNRKGTPAPSGGWCLRVVMVCAGSKGHTASTNVSKARISFFVKTNLLLKVTMDTLGKLFVKLRWRAYRSAQDDNSDGLLGAIARRRKLGKQSSKILLQAVTDVN